MLFLSMSWRSEVGVKPLALKGKSDRTSLRVLCRNHNIQQGIQFLGHDRMKRLVPSLK
jgi:hypothetical protein